MTEDNNKKELSILKSKVFLRVLFSIIIVCIAAVASVFYHSSKKIQTIDIDVAKARSLVMIERNAMLIDLKLIETKRKHTLLLESYQRDVDSYQRQLTNFMNENNPVFVNLLDNDGVPFLYQGEESLLRYYRPQLDRQSHVSSPYYGYGGTKQITFEEPLLKGNEHVGVMCISYPIKAYFELYGNEFLDSNHYSCIIDRSGIIVYASKKLEKERRFNNLFDSLHKDGVSDDSMAVIETVLDNHAKESLILPYGDGKAFYGIIPLEGHEGWYTVSILPQSILIQEEALKNSGMSILFFMLVVLIISFAGYFFINNKVETKETKKRLSLDTLTGLYNFVGFKEAAQYALTLRPKQKFALVFCDIKQFKMINDSYGYHVGDALLRYIGVILDSDYDTVVAGRISNDNYIVLIQYELQEDLSNYHVRIQQALSSTTSVVPENVLLVLFSGFYIIPKTWYVENISVQSMMDRAKIAHKESKKSNNQSMQIYSDAMLSSQVVEYELEKRMNIALENSEFLVYLQPKVRLSDKKVVSCEALVRWAHPEKDLIMPNEFIPLFEKNGFIRQLDTYMLEKSCILLSKWVKIYEEVPQIAVNVSKALLNDDVFLFKFTGIIEKYDIPLKLIELEFTESLAINSPDRLREVVDYFRNKGFCCAIDDFGSGYSSLNLLRSIDLDTLKLDRLFFNRTGTSDREKTIVRNIVNMAHELKMVTVAEGVEHTETVSFLEDIGCEYVQGFVYAKPMTIEQFESTYLSKKSTQS